MLARVPWSPPIVTKPKPRALNRDRRRHLVETTAAILRSGTPTNFAFEAAARHGIRSSLCLQHWDWDEADRAAADIVTAALRVVGAIRPSWAQGQPEHTSDGFAPIERTRCATCGGKLRSESQTKFCSQNCNAVWHNRIARDFGLRVDRAEWLARVAVDAEHRRRQREVTCEHCREPFHVSYTGQRFCRRSCAYAARLAHRPETTCACCGTVFAFDGRPSLAPKYCPDCAESGRWRVKREARTCPICEATFEPQSDTHSYCSPGCARKAERLAPKRCENCQRDFQPKRKDARFCGNRCSQLALARYRREASGFRCEAA